MKKINLAPLIFFEIIGGLVLYFFSLLLFAKIARNIFEEEWHAMDVAISQAIYSIRNPYLTEIMLWITYLGADFILLTAGILAAFLAWKRRRLEAMIFILVLSMGVTLNMLLKLLFQRPRPDLDPLLNLSSYSFPSGHAMNAFIFYSVLAYFVFHFTRKKKLSITISLLSLTIIVLIGFSRVYLGVHYPSDVIAGFIAGFSVLTTGITIEKTLFFFRVTKKKRKKL